MALDPYRTASLVRRCRRGDQAAWAELVWAYSRYVYAILRRAFDLTDDEIEELFDEVWLRASRKLGSLRDEKAFKPWLRQVTRSAAFDYIDARRNDEVLVGDIGPLVEAAAPVTSEAPEIEALDELDEAMGVWERVKELGEPCAEILSRRFGRDQKFAAIAEALGITVGSVSGHIHRCLGRLRTLLERTDDGDEPSSEG